jgi:hypothetical protein
MGFTHLKTERNPGLNLLNPPAEKKILGMPLTWDDDKEVIKQYSHVFQV